VFAIAIELLARRYTATQFDDRSRPEWPPHPARLYSAMVAAWADSDDPDPDERAALCWLEEQGAPEIHCGAERPRTVVTHFVPVNDATALNAGAGRSTWAVVEGARLALAQAEGAGDGKLVRRAEAALSKARLKAVTDGLKAGALTGRESASIAGGVLEVLPERRGKQGRTYPTVIPDHPDVWFVWPEAQPSPGTGETLDAVLARVGRLGHSSTLVSCRACGDGPPSEPAWVPGRADGGVRLRVPRKGLLDRLELAFATHQGEEPRTLPAAMLSYQPPSPARQQPVRNSALLGGDWYILGFTGHPLPVAQQALALTRAARAALLHHAAEPVPEVISGHQRSQGATGPTPPLDKPHLAVLPLLNAGHPHSDGTVYGLALVLPAECTAEGRSAVEEALRSWAAADRRGTDEFALRLPGEPGGRPVEYSLVDLGTDRGHAGAASEWLNTSLTSRRKTTTRDYWCRPARRWLTVTPVALDRFPGNLLSRDPATRDRAEAEAAESVARACVYAGLADRVEDVSVRIGLTAPLVGLPAVRVGQHAPGQRHYPGYRTGSGQPRPCVHAEIEFPEPVRGPVLIGAGRYLGYGLCLPRQPRTET
jgi:CRISPR-associated protein Csb2